MKPKEILSIPLIIPEDYTIRGFRQRNQDNFYSIGDAIIDRHFQCSQKLLPGEKIIAHVEELVEPWEKSDCIKHIKFMNGIFPNALGLTLLFEQGEGFLYRILKYEPGHDDRKNIKIIGIDEGDSLWWKNDDRSLAIPSLSNKHITGLDKVWVFKLVGDHHFGKKEDLLLYFTRPEEKE